MARSTRTQARRKYIREASFIKVAEYSWVTKAAASEGAKRTHRQVIALMEFSETTLNGIFRRGAARFSNLSTFSTISNISNFVTFDYYPL